MSKQLDASQTIERFGVSRTAWRVGVICFFALFALVGACLSLVNGSTDIPMGQILEILAAPGADPYS
ncbi:MAG: iron ABC transporter permease, partial [Phascolarctobacterium sp.]|nr:iron ABC transporter permease [Phascolarctobacterium sp.]